jgi:D-glycero-alpha-D-manno-heptose-7-phosphate kinase
MEIFDKKNLFTTNSSSTIREALKVISSNNAGAVFVVGENERVIGIATDGDIRSALVSDASLSDTIDVALNSNFVWSKPSDSRESILKLLDSRIKLIPILDGDMRLVDVVTSEKISSIIEKNIFSRSRAPVRISFAGGGSDLTHYFMSEGGAVINATISIYCHATLRIRDDLKISIDSMDLGQKIKFNNLEDFLSREDDFDLFRSLLKLIKPDFGFDLIVDSDFPSGSGLGGSSAVMIAISGCFNEFRKDKWNDYELAEMAFQAERLNMGISGGWQDQYASVFGGFNFIEFREDSNLIYPLRLKEKTLLELQENLILFEITSGRNSGSIHDDQKVMMQSENIQKMVRKNVKHCHTMKESLLRGHLSEFGSGLNIAWSFKRTFSDKISNPELDSLYMFAIDNGALGGKLLGAGGGGFFLFYVKPDKRNGFLSAMKEKGYNRTVFNFEHNGMQSWTVRDESN